MMISQLIMQVKEFETEREILKERINELSAAFEKKTEEAAKYSISIQTQEQMIHTLETDKADLFQKMQFIDEQTRTEMSEKFHRDQLEIEESWQQKLNDNIEIIRCNLEQDHLENLKQTVGKLEKQQYNENEQLRFHYFEKEQELKQDKAELERQLQEADNYRKELMRQLLEAKEVHTREKSDLEINYNFKLKEEKQKWDSDSITHETHLKVASTKALAALEKSHQMKIEEIEISQKKQLDDLRNFHTMTTLSSKKV
ncbi:hypothetical protein HK096_000673 [Nowakowskiella sp. JEL0078]|nr:hypothetical protein HK096_000673 [Nowakowskiella sp. JEL0078]